MKQVREQQVTTYWWHADIEGSPLSCVIAASSWTAAKRTAREAGLNPPKQPGLCRDSSQQRRAAAHIGCLLLHDDEDDRWWIMTASGRAGLA